MKYLRVRNFWDYQNADAWKKAKANKGGHRHPAWCKLFVQRDMEMDNQPAIVRLVFWELLRVATIDTNVISNDSQAIAKRISLPTQQVSQAIEALCKGGWLSQTSSARRSRAPSRDILETFYTEAEVKLRDIPPPIVPPLATVNGLPFANELVTIRLIQSIGPMNEDQLGAVRAAARRLPEGLIAKVTESVVMNRPRNRVGYALAALRDEAT